MSCHVVLQGIAGDTAQGRRQLLCGRRYGMLCLRAITSIQGDLIQHSTCSRCLWMKTARSHQHTEKHSALATRLPPWPAPWYVHHTTSHHITSHLSGRTLCCLKRCTGKTTAWTCLTTRASRPSLQGMARSFTAIHHNVATPKSNIICLDLCLSRSFEQERQEMPSTPLRLPRPSDNTLAAIMYVCLCCVTCLGSCAL